jgi:hypothetical protein
MEGEIVSDRPVTSVSSTDAKSPAALWSWLPRVDRQWAYRGLVVLASLCFLHVFPSVLFIVYMGSRGFFDYEFFQQGLFALNVFYGTAELVVIMVALITFGAVIPWWQRLRHKAGSLAVTIALTTVNVAVIVYLTWPIALGKSGWLAEIAVLFSLAACIAIHMAVVLHEKAQTALVSLLMLFTFVGVLVGIAPRQVAGLLSMGLRVYNAGGGVSVSVHDGAQHNDGALIFLGPKHAYVVFKGAATMTVLPRSETLTLQFTLPKRDVPDQDQHGQ